MTLLEVAAIPTEMATRTSAIDFTFLFVKMIAALVVCCVAALLVLKYLVPKLSLANRFASQDKIKIISRVSLAPKQYLYLVKVADKCILLGGTDGGINKIADVEEKE